MSEDFPIPTGRYAGLSPRVHLVTGLAVEPASEASDAILQLQLKRAVFHELREQAVTHRFALSRRAAEILRNQLDELLDD